MDDFELVGTGLTVFEHDELVEGTVVWLDSPTAVMEFVTSRERANSIVLARGGTTTFLTPALSAGVKGIVTLQGAPESHLGILSREYGIPCLMSVAFTEGVRSARGEAIPPDGAIVRLDLRGSPAGAVLIAQADRTYVTDRDDEPVAEDPEAAEQAARLKALMTNFRGEIPEGVRGHRQMHVRLRSGVLDGNRGNLYRDLRPDEIGDFLAYTGWNLWDHIKARQTEGESGLIPRQEYETIAFVQQWSSYARWIEQITDRVGADGVIEIGRSPRKEIGTKANQLHIVGVGTSPLVGKAIAGQLALDSDLDDTRNANTIIQFVRRLQYGVWGDGPGFVSGRGYRLPVLESEWLNRFVDEETPLDDPDRLAAFRTFNATTELAGFLLHYDCRAGMCDTGPYPLPDGGFVIVRDHFLHETAYEWGSDFAGLPYCVTEAMFFRPDIPVEISVTDMATTFARPRNYLKHLSGAAVYARDRWDTPINEIRRLGDAEMAQIVARCNASMLSLYTSIGELPWDERIRNGVKVYCRDMLLPYARAAGLWDSMTQEGFDEFTPLAEQAYPVLAGGKAAPVLGMALLTGEGLVPEGGLGDPPEVGEDALPALHALALRGHLQSLPDGPVTAEMLIDADLVAQTAAGYLLTDRGHRRHEELFAAERASLDTARLAQVYERFLAVNGQMKTVCVRAGSASEDTRFELLGQAEQLIRRVDPALRRSAELLPRFGRYRSRLTQAMQRADGGQWEYLSSPTVESVHTVWMECHEDYLQTLGRSREQEGSY